MPKMITLEMHLHTIDSKDSLMQPEKIMEVAQQRGIDKVAITDHNRTTLAQRIHERYPGRVVVGEEILTTRGELLAFFVRENVPAGLEPMEALKRLKEQGAFISVSHPYDRQRSGWHEEDLLEILPEVDALEVFNARCLQSAINDRADALAKEYHLLATVGSDAHTYGEIGTALVHLPDFMDAAGLRASLANATFDARLSPPWVHVGSRWVAFVKKFGFGSIPTTAIDE